ncbi:hypothetical protein KSP40_PGU019677 [Platanthera guangdongensis]|uniref:PX domain-containing protein n=1 Tax=Platanthera guangdongensis TaxID=2320717 RepID=A0ABR2MNP7_9ASPA
MRSKGFPHLRCGVRASRNCGLVAYRSNGLTVSRRAKRMVITTVDRQLAGGLADWRLARAIWRYRNFERLHRKLKEIRNYSLSLPPKRFLSSSIDDYFVHQRCILLDKYLQDLLAIANIAEQHEVWDFLSDSSKNYSFGKSTSVMKTLAVNMDDAVDDIVRQFKRKVVGPSPSLAGSSTQAEHSVLQARDNATSLSWNEETKKLSPSYSNIETSHSVSDDDTHEEDPSSVLASGWHSDNELKGLPPRITKYDEESNSLVSQNCKELDQFKRINLDNFSTSNNSVASDNMEYLARIPPEVLHFFGGISLVSICSFLLCSSCTNA